MQLKNDTRTGLTSEIRIIPPWVWVLAGIAFVGTQLAFDIFFARQPNGPPAWARPLLGLILGVVSGCYLLLIGYINRDAKRRGMSPTLWTIVAIIIPNALGILLYFVLRHALRSACPQCAHAVETTFCFCPQCSCRLSPSCPQCQRLVGLTDAYCPYCGNSLRKPAPPAQDVSPVKE
jgi:Double zinc ribbon